MCRGSPGNELVNSMGRPKSQQDQKAIRDKDVAIGPRNPKGSSKKPMRVKEAKRKSMGQGNPRNKIMKWAGTARVLANKVQKR